MRDLFRRLTGQLSDLELAARELDEAKKSLLDASTQTEFYAAIIQYNQARIRRLTRYLAEAQRSPERSAADSEV